MNVKSIKISKIIKSPRNLIIPLSMRGFLNWVPDKIYLKLVYWAKTGEKLNLDNPTKYNEKLQWLKINDRKERYSEFVDKYAVRSYIKETIGEQYLIPLIDVYDNVHEINWSTLPNKFVLKCTHGSGSNIVCTNKDELDINDAKKKLEKWMKRNWYWLGRSYPYKNIKPKIICEEFLSDENDKALKDYKFFCFNGQPKLIQVDIDRFEKHKQNFYDTEWNFRDVEIHSPNDKNLRLSKPRVLSKMLKISKKLSENLPHLRVDLYCMGDKIYFGELTFFHMSGMSKFRNKEFEYEMGEWLKLPNKNDL